MEIPVIIEELDVVNGVVVEATITMPVQKFVNHIRILFVPCLQDGSPILVRNENCMN